MSNDETGKVVIGLFLAVLAGLLNGSWNVAFSPTTKRICAHGLSHAHAWILFQVYAALVVNLPIGFGLAGGREVVSSTVANASLSSILLVCIFSVLWGVGSVGFGVACRVAGVRLGTNVCIGTIIILGSLLPLLLEGQAATTQGAIVLVGLFVCSVGLVRAVQSLQTRDASDGSSTTVVTGELGQEPQKQTTHTNNVLMDVSSPEKTDIATLSVALEVGITEEKPDEREIELPQVSSWTTTSASDPPRTQEKATASPTVIQSSFSTWQKIVICIVAGIFATMLQFAFVFGEDLQVESSTIDDNDNDDNGNSATNSVIWIFAVSLGTPVSIVYGFCQIRSSGPSKNNDDDQQDDPPLSFFQAISLRNCPWYRHVTILLTTSVPWVGHIHLYGLATTLLPSQVAASVAWPILMMTTVVTGTVWSVFYLQEWKTASALAKSQLRQSLAIMTLGVGILMASVAAAI